MLQDARALAPGSSISADVCIVGAGPAGISLALELEQISTATILLIESGGWDFDPDVNNLNAGELDLQGNIRPPGLLQDLRRRQIGGTSNMWGGYCRPLTDVELGPQPQQPVSGWPLTRADLNQWYVKAHDMIQLGPFDYSPTEWTKRLGISPPLDLGPDLETHLYFTHATRFGALYQNALTSSSRITLLHHANVLNVNVNGTGGHVNSLSIATLDGVDLTASAATFVLATGGIEGPRLLLASNDVMPAGVGNEHDLVGRYYSDHLGFALGFLVVAPPRADVQLYTGGNPYDTTTPSGTPTSLQVYGGFQISPAAKQREGLTGTHIEMIIADAGQHPTQTSGVTMEDVRELVRSGSAGQASSVAGFRGFVEPVADPESRVLLSDTLDPFGRPRTKLQWRVASVNGEHVRRGMEVMGDAIGAIGLGRLQHTAGWISVDNTRPGAEAIVVTPNGDAPDPPVESTLHHMCATRMDVDATKGVVDTDCRVHTVDNLYISSCSVFPVPAGHYPTITIVALALRLAHHLAGLSS